MITYNGNEMMLQNDMGNTLIQDSATGNIMGLNPGFIPIGMKEHGGIMYIASVDKEGNGEIGTIPSPIIRDFYKDRVGFEVNQSIPINAGDAIKISNKLYPADKFIANLQMSIDETNLIGQKFKKDSGLSPSPVNDPSDIILGRDVIRYTAGLAKKQILYTPVLSYNSNISEIQLLGLGRQAPLFSSKGIYRLELYSRHDNSSDVLVDSLASPQLYQYGAEFVESNYWYIHTEFPTSVFPKDLLTATLNQNLKQFPSNGKPGYLAVKLLTEGINKFDILPRAKEPFYTPITYKDYQSGSKPQYYTYFPGFYYSTNSGIYIDRIEARVIDESTASEMTLKYPYKDDSIPQFTIDKLETGSLTQGWQNSYLYPPRKLTGFFANTWESEPGGHMYNPYKISNALPQVQSISDYNSFILTTLKNITDHSKTFIESSTKGENKTYGGVFCVPLGENYNNWYRAEIDYYDQYNNKQGTFTKRFNPYLNDVFGTNLYIDGWVGGSGLIIGKEVVIEKKDYSDSESRTITCLSDTYYNVPFKDPSGKIDEYLDHLNIPIFQDSTPTKSNTLKWNIPNKSITVDVSEYTQNLKSLVNSTESVYMYPIVNQIKQTEVAVTGSCILTSAELYSTNNTPVYKFHIGESDDAGSLVLGKRTLHTKLIWVDSEKYTLYQKNMSTESYLYWTFYNDGNNEESTSNFPEMNNRYFEYNKALFGAPNTKIKISDIINGTLAVPYKVGAFGNSGTISLAFGTMYHGNDRYPNATGPQHSLYTSLSGDSYQKNYYGIKLTYLNSFSFSLPSWTLSPYYSILSHFCLTGTNEEGQQVNVQRFGKKDNTDIVYEHNFELDTSGKPVNYYVELSDVSTSVIRSCTYTHAHPFLYYTLQLSYTNTLQPGIYVLNIQRVPGTAKAELNPIFHLNAVLEIGIGNIIKSFDAKTGWVITPTYNEGMTNKSNIEVYSPIVIIVPNTLEISITTDKNFYRQNIGLYKIKTCNDEEIQNLTALQSDMISPYCTYMSNLAQTAQYLYSYDKVKEYSFILKYGVFFKESYVFIDGLVDQSNIAGITVDLTYSSYPYIPSDPSMLPISISPSDLNGSETTWNAYVMPKSVLNVSGDAYPNFVFSNPIKGWSFSTAPLPGNLRQRVDL